MSRDGKTQLKPRFEVGSGWLALGARHGRCAERGVTPAGHRDCWRRSLFLRPTEHVFQSFSGTLGPLPLISRVLLLGGSAWRDQSGGEPPSLLFCQGGPVVELLSGQGKDPVARWKLSGGPAAIQKVSELHSCSVAGDGCTLLPMGHLLSNSLTGLYTANVRTEGSVFN